ncbi:MAG: sce7726 family protein [Methyloceanibacter sp.]|uniref:sce7726 family protein n=1 Tax=Methyloceanibacter sp. TaxID=1965321 RepID=UPI003D6C758D
MSRYALREVGIKAALIDDLFETGAVDDASVIVNEMLVPGWRRRADLVHANGQLVAYEIKSEADSLARLPGQIDSFTRWFEGVAVVVAPKHVQNVLASIEDGVGVFTASVEEGAVSIRRVRPIRLASLGREAALRHMSTADLGRVAKSQGLTSRACGHRQTLEVIVSELPLASLRIAAIEAIKRRHSRTYDRFLSARSCVGTSIAMASLRKSAWGSYSS